MPNIADEVRAVALKKIDSWVAVTRPQYEMFDNQENTIFLSDGVDAKPGRPGNYEAFIDEIYKLANTGSYKTAKSLSPRSISGFVHTLLLVRARRIAAITGYDISYKNGVYATDYVAPEPVEEVVKSELEKAKDEWEGWLLEAAQVLDQDSRDAFFAELTRLEYADLFV